MAPNAVYSQVSTQSIPTLRKEKNMGTIATFKLVDDKGRMTLLKNEVDGATPADQIDNAEALSALLAATTKLGLVSGQITFPLSVTPTAAAEGSNTDVGGKVKGPSDDDGKMLVLRIPDPLDAIVNTTGGFDLEEEHIEAYIAEFVTGQSAMLSDGEQVSSWLTGELDSR